MNKELQQAVNYINIHLKGNSAIQVLNELETNRQDGYHYLCAYVSVETLDVDGMSMSEICYKWNEEGELMSVDGVEQKYKSVWRDDLNRHIEVYDKSVVLASNYNDYKINPSDIKTIVIAYDDWADDEKPIAVYQY